MPNKPLQAVTFANPGFLGLNKQDSGVNMDLGFALSSLNTVIDKSGRLAARKGWKYNTTSGGTASNIKSALEFDNNDGTYTLLSAGNNKFFTGETTLTEIFVRNTTNTANQSVTITDSNWQMIQTQFDSGRNRSEHAYLLQKNHQMLVYHKLPSTGTGAEVTVSTVAAGKITAVTVSTAGTGYAPGDLCTVSGGTGTGAEFTVLTVGTGGTVLTVSITNQGTGYTASDVLSLIDTDYHSHESGYGLQRFADVSKLPAGYTVDTFKPNCGLSAFGRLWVADIGPDNLTIYFSDLLQPDNFQDGDSGFINLEEVVPGGDKIVALAAHNNYLIVFCTNNIVIYSNPVDVTALQLSDTIEGIGCIARDSVQIIGTDLIFVSNSGVRSLGRTIQEKSSPLNDISKNVRDEFLLLLTSEIKENMRSVYYEPEAFYLISFPVSKFIYCFDVRTPLQDGSFRVTIWDTIEPNCFVATRNRRLLIGKTNGVAEYNGYRDNGNPYTMTYYTPYIDFGNASVTKILKKIVATILGMSNTAVELKWSFDYDTDYNTIQTSTAATSVYEYGIAEYGLAEYAASAAIEQLKQPLSGVGNIVQIGVEALINGTSFSIQKLDVYSVTGRII